MTTDATSQNAGEDAETVVRRLQAAWAANDIDTMMACIAEDVVYTLHIDEGTFPFAGASRGKPTVRAALAQMRAAFEYVLYRPMTFTRDGNVLRHQVEFMYRHRVSGEMLSGRFRIVWTVRDGLVTTCQEYHDAARVEAFGRLVGIVPENG